MLINIIIILCISLYIDSNSQLQTGDFIHPCIETIVLSENECDFEDDDFLNQDVITQKPKNISTISPTRIHNETDEYLIKDPVTIENNFFANIVDISDPDAYRRLKFRDQQTGKMVERYIPRSVYTNLQTIISNALIKIEFENKFWRSQNTNYVDAMKDCDGDITQCRLLKEEEKDYAGKKVANAEEVASNYRKDFGASYMVTDKGIYFM